MTFASNEEQRWNWFLAADYEGKWMTTNGYADVTFKDTNFTASLRYSPDTDVCHHISASVDPENGIEALVTSPWRDAAPFELHGQLFKGAVVDGVETITVLLTNGTTVIGLSVGPRSHERNL
jgi:hypothetical protein